jgi:hypothetical protein
VIATLLYAPKYSDNSLKEDLNMTEKVNFKLIAEHFCVWGGGGGGQERGSQDSIGFAVKL